MKIKEALSWAVDELEKNGIPDVQTDAEYLLTFVLRCKRHELYMNPERMLSESEASVFERFVRRRLLREPAQYITGQTEFRGLPFKVTRDTLIPRPETELLVEEAIRCARSIKKKTITAVDLCAGSACIAVSFAKELSESIVYATDISAGAIEVARKNAQINGVSDRIVLLEGDLYEPLAKRGIKDVDLIISNPPYVPDTEREGLAPEVKDYEPAAALYAGEEGLDFYKRIIKDAPSFLAPGGFLLLELGWGQAGKVLKLLSDGGRFDDLEVKKDYSGIDRVLKAVFRMG